MIQHGLYQQSGHNTQPYRMRRQFGIYLRQHVEHYYAYHESTGKTGYEIYRAFSYPFTEKTYGKHCQHGCSEKYYIIRHKGIYFSVGRKFTSKITFSAIRMTVKKTHCHKKHPCETYDENAGAQRTEYLPRNVTPHFRACNNIQKKQRQNTAGIRTSVRKVPF